ncbi:MAG TPA: hypothetical protein DIW47_08385 [Bacteroidetes bacterium]|nr:hypothetical protein [Bacteroidota bacterium]
MKSKFFHDFKDRDSSKVFVPFVDCLLTLIDTAQLMLRYLKSCMILTLLIALAPANKAVASDIMGADMTYRCLGNDSFEFTTIVYKDCNANWTIPANTYNLFVSAIGCTYTQQTISPTLVSCVDITPVCDGYCTKCNSTCNSNTSNSSCSFPYGIEKLTFKAIVYLGNTSCCNFHIGYIGNSTRNTATTTCCNTDLFYTYVELDRCVTPCNSSPIFTNDPVGIICAGQDFAFNNGALDSLDGDSLSFELAPAMRSKTNQATYYGSFSYTKPLTFLGFPNANGTHPSGFHVDPVSGDLTFRPTQANQIAVIVIKVTEWRKVGGAWVKVGEMRRDMQFIVINCPNNAVPEIDPPYTFNACTGQKICVDVVTDDANTNDTVRISWNKGIKGATFTNNNGAVKHAKGEVCWTPKESDISNIPYTFTIAAKDNACPVTGQSIRSFSIFVRETPKATITTQVLNCGKVALHYVPYKTYPGFVANWSIRDANNKPVFGSANNMEYDTAFLQPGKYTATLLFRTGTPCFEVASDTFTVADFVRVDIPSDTFVCAGGSLWIDGRTWDGTAPYSHIWTQMTDTTPYGPIETNEDITVVPDTTTRYVIQVTDASECKNWDTVRVSYALPPPVDLGNDLRVCKGDNSLLDAGNDSMTLSYYWVTGDTARTLLADKNFSYWVRVTDSLGCKNYDTLFHQLASMALTAGPDLRACEGDTLKLGASGADSYRWYNQSGFSLNPLPASIGNTDSLTYIVTQNKGFIVRGLKAFDTLQCAYLDTVLVAMDPAPYNQLAPLGPYCPNDAAVSLITSVQFPTAFDGVWTSTSSPSSVNNGMFYPALAGSGNHVLSYEVTDVLGCKTRKNITIQVKQAPALQLLDTQIVCANEKELLLNTYKLAPANYTGLKVDWYEANGNPSIAANLDKSDPLNTKLRLNTNVPAGTYKLVLRLEYNTNGCANFDTATLIVKPIPLAEAGTFTPVCFNDPLFDLNTASGATPGGGIWTSSVIIQAPSGFLPASIGMDKQYTGDQLWFYYTRSLNTCTTTDSVLLTIKPLPQLYFPVDSFCMDAGTLDLKTLVTPVGTGSSWTGTGINGSFMDMVVAGKGWHAIGYNFQAANGCKNSIQGQIYLEIPPELSATIPNDVCEGEKLALHSTFSDASGVRWTGSGDGVFDGGAAFSDLAVSSYAPGTSDLSNGNVTIQVITRQGSACPEKQISKQVRVITLPLPVIVAQQLSGCEPLDVDFEVQGTIPANSRYTWNYGEGQDTTGIDLFLGIKHRYNKYGTYPVSLRVLTDISEGACYAEAETVNIEVFPKPRAIPDADKWVTNVNFPGIQFRDRSTVEGDGVINYWEWQFGDPDNGSSNAVDPYYEYPILSDNDSVSYRVHLLVRTMDDCWDTASRVLLIIPELSVFIPNAFTPNGQDMLINEQFVVVAGNYKSIRIRVFNRWGEEVFYSEDVNRSWDGKYKGVPVQQDVYLYLVEVVSVYDKVYRYSGTVTVLP